MQSLPGRRVFVGLLCVAFLSAFCLVAALPVSVMNQETDLVDRLFAHSFYYSWYGNPAQDNKWIHWNHEILDGSGVYYEPPADIGANFYPELGCYSSLDPAIVRKHMEQHRRAGLSVISFSWWGRDASDGQGSTTDKAVRLTMDIAAEYGISINFHIEPYPGRNSTNVKRDLEYIIENYGSHPAFFRHPSYGNRPLYYFYDSYITPASDWASILDPTSPNTIRGTSLDGLFIALYVNHDSRPFVLDGKFDGFYTYFAVDGFTQGSTARNWAEMCSWARTNSLVSILSVGPGYNDTRIRPWNAVNERSRENGAYYDRVFEAAISAGPTFMSITSFNEWHEGTQIEPAIPFNNGKGYDYEDYGRLDAGFYLDRTSYWVQRFISSSKKE